MADNAYLKAVFSFNFRAEFHQHHGLQLGIIAVQVCQVIHVQHGRTLHIVDGYFFKMHPLGIRGLTDEVGEASDPLSSNCSSCSFDGVICVQICALCMLAGSYVSLSRDEIQVGAWVDFFGSMHLSNALPLPTPLSFALPFPPAMF